jgi:nucleoside-diphosphate-sugar epimerase
MGYHRFMRALLREEPVTVYGDGQQVRGNTYVSDCVSATLAAVEAHRGETYNVGGGEAVTVWDIIHKLEALAGCRALIKQEPARPRDQRYALPTPPSCVGTSAGNRTPPFKKGCPASGNGRSVSRFNAGL